MREKEADPVGGTSLRQRLRWWVRQVRRAPERVLHPMRRGVALARLRRREEPRAVLLVCHGNVCRSPYAELALVHVLSPEQRARVQVDSAGFVGPNRSVPPAALSTASARGIDLSAHCSSLLTPERVRAADLVVVMDAGQRRAIVRRFAKDAAAILVLGDLDPEPIETRTIRDPWDQPPEVFVKCYERIDRCIAVLAEAIGTRS